MVTEMPTSAADPGAPAYPSDPRLDLSNNTASNVMGNYYTAVCLYTPVYPSDARLDLSNNTASNVMGNYYTVVCLYTPVYPSDPRLDLSNNTASNVMGNYYTQLSVYIHLWLGYMVICRCTCCRQLVLWLVCVI